MNRSFQQKASVWPGSKYLWELQNVRLPHRVYGLSPDKAQGYIEEQIEIFEARKRQDFLHSHRAEVDRLEQACRDESLVLRPTRLFRGGWEVLQHSMSTFQPNFTQPKFHKRSLPEHRGQQCRMGLTEPLKWQNGLLHPEPSPTLPPWVREWIWLFSSDQQNRFGTERPGRDSAMREAVRLDVRPAPTSSTDPLAILTTKNHSETLEVTRIFPGNSPAQACLVMKFQVTADCFVEAFFTL